MKNNIDAMLSEVTKLTTNFKKQQAEMVAKIKPLFGELFLPYLNKYSEVQSLYFTAYTPYFNDGETCYFGVNDLYGVTEDDEEFGDSYGPSYGDCADFLETGVISEDIKRYIESYTKPSKGYNYGWSHNAPVTPAKYATLEAALRGEYSHKLDLGVDELRKLDAAIKDFASVRGILNELGDDLIEQMFGDHIKVTITREGVEVEECDHE